MILAERTHRICCWVGWKEEKMGVRISCGELGVWVWVGGWVGGLYLSFLLGLLLVPDADGMVGGGSGEALAVKVVLGVQEVVVVA